MRVALYARVSTGDQKCESQIAALQEHCRRHDHEIVGVYKDTISGVRGNRPGRDLLMESVLRGEVDAVLCTKLDRWARSVQDCCATVDRLHKAGVHWYAIDQGLGVTGDATGRLLFLMLAAVAEFERELIRERTKASLDHLRDTRGYIRPQKVWDRKAAWEDRLSGMPFNQLERKYKIERRTMIRGWVEYAEANNLDTTQVLGYPEKWRKKGGKPAKPTTCRICGVTHPTQQRERGCCVKQKQENPLPRSVSRVTPEVREQMYRDRLAGMSWAKIGAKHGFSFTHAQRTVQQLMEERKPAD